MEKALVRMRSVFTVYAGLIPVFGKVAHISQWSQEGRFHNGFSFWASRRCSVASTLPSITPLHGRTWANTPKILRASHARGYPSVDQLPAAGLSPMRLFVIIHSFNRTTPLLRIEASAKVHP